MCFHMEPNLQMIYGLIMYIALTCLFLCLKMMTNSIHSCHEISYHGWYSSIIHTWVQIDLNEFALRLPVLLYPNTIAVSRLTLQHKICCWSGDCYYGLLFTSLFGRFVSNLRFVGRWRTNILNENEYIRHCSTFRSSFVVFRNKFPLIKSHHVDDEIAKSVRYV